MARRDPTHIKDLQPDNHNARKHNPRNIGLIETALHEVGPARSIVIDEENNILAGNGTIEAAAQAGFTKVQVVDADGETIIAVRRTGLSDTEKQRLALYDNRTAELAGWNSEVIAAMLVADPGAMDGLFTPEELDPILKLVLEPEDEVDEAMFPEHAQGGKMVECPHCHKTFDPKAK